MQLGPKQTSQFKILVSGYVRKQEISTYTIIADTEKEAHELAMEEFNDDCAHEYDEVDEVEIYECTYIKTITVAQPRCGQTIEMNLADANQTAEA